MDSPHNDFASAQQPNVDDMQDDAEIAPSSQLKAARRAEEAQGGQAPTEQNPTLARNGKQAQLDMDWFQKQEKEEVEPIEFGNQNGDEKFIHISTIKSSLLSNDDNMKQNKEGQLSQRSKPHIFSPQQTTAQPSNQDTSPTLKQQAPTSDDKLKAGPISIQPTEHQNPENAHEPGLEPETASSQPVAQSHAEPDKLSSSQKQSNEQASGQSDLISS